MRTDSLRPQFSGVDPPTTTPRSVSPDPAFAALSRFVRLRDTLAAAAKRAKRRVPDQSEAPVFFFDPRCQAELEAARPKAVTPTPHPLTQQITSELPELFRSVEVRRVARVIPGLREAASALSGEFPAANDLAALLGVPDDETVLVLHPRRRAGFRIFVRGVVDVYQFHMLLADAVVGDPDDGYLAGPPLPARFRAAYCDANPTFLAGEPIVAEARFQLFRPSGVQSDGSVPEGFRGCDHWLWGKEPLAAVPRVDGERVVVLGEPAFQATWDVERRFPTLPAEVQLLRVLGPFEVAERLSRLAGQPVPVRVAEETVEVLARAA